MRMSSQKKPSKTIKPYIRFLLLLLTVILLAGAVWAGIRFAVSSCADENTRNAIASAEYAQLSSALETFDTIGYPNADIAGQILPELRLRFHAATVLDELLAHQYGERYALIDAEIYRYITLTMEEIDSAVAQGASTDLGVENLRVYMLLLQDQLAQRFDADGAVLPTAH